MQSDSGLLPKSDTPPQVAVATSLLPWRKDDNRARYLGYLACGFMPEEAIYMLGLTPDWLDEQRADEEFSSVELRVPEIRKELSKEYIELDFFRNFRMVLEKDYRVLRKALEIDSILSNQDHQYLLKMRSAYTPQQLQILEQVMKGVGEEGWNFAQWINKNRDKVLRFSRTDSVELIDDGKKKDNS